MKRILVTITGQGSMMYLIRSGLLDELKNFCRPVVVLLWQQDDFMRELNAKGIETHVIPPYEVDAQYSILRQKINTWYKYFQLKTQSTVIAQRLHNRYRPAKVVRKNKLKEFILRSRFFFDRKYIQQLVKEEAMLIKTQPCFEKYYGFIKTLQPDGLLTVTPFLQEIELIARILKEEDKKIVAAIHSFDNITKRGWPALFFDQYLVWNKYNKAELERINPALKQNRTHITGAPQFDAHYNLLFQWNKKEWLQKLQLPEGKKIILYAGGSENLFPDEPQYLRHLADAIEEKKIGDNTIILFRCHPLDKVQRWKDATGERPYVFYDSRPPINRKIDYDNVTADDIAKLVSTLMHTDVHVSICSTMTIDGSVFGKPVIGPYYDEAAKENEAALRGIYMQEHYKPIMQTGVVQLAKTKYELTMLVNKALEQPRLFASEGKRCVEEIITYTDGKSSQRVASFLEKYFA